MAFTTIGSAINSAILADGQLFSIRAFYTDFYGTGSASIASLNRSQVWRNLVTIINNDFVSAEDLIFIACQLTSGSRNKDYKLFIKAQRADSSNAFVQSLFDKDSTNGVHARTTNRLASMEQKQEHLSKMVINQMARTNVLEQDNALLKADNALLKADNALLNESVALLKADNALLNESVAWLKDKCNSLEAMVQNTLEGMAQMKSQLASALTTIAQSLLP